MQPQGKVQIKNVALRPLVKPQKYLSWCLIDPLRQTIGLLRILRALLPQHPVSQHKVGGDL